MPRKAGPGRAGTLDTQLRKWVLKSDITKIRKLIMDGANPNFISQQVPDSKSTNEHFNALGIACMSKKPLDTIKTIIEVSASKNIKLDFVPKDPRILNDDNQTKESVLHTACIRISSPAKLSQVIELLGEQEGVDFNYTAWHNMSPIAFLLHEDAFIADPREPLKKLLEHGCNPNTKCYVESDAEPGSEFEDEEEDEGFVCPDNTYKYPSALKPEKFQRSIGYIWPEFNNCTPPKWRKKAQVEEGIQSLLADYRKKFTLKNKAKMKEAQKEFWSKLENQEYLENYKQSMKNKRTDEPKKISDRHWGELYNLTLEEESPEKDPHKNKLDPSDQKYNLKTRKSRQAANKIALMFNPDCDCCMQRMKLDEASKVPKENTKSVLEKVSELGDSSKSQSQSPATNQSTQSQPKTQNEPKIETPKFRKNKTPKKSRKSVLEKFEPIISKCFHCDKESCKETPLQRCSACNRINYCSRNCQRNDWARHKSECKEWQAKKLEMEKKEIIELTSDETDPIESDQSDTKPINASQRNKQKTTKTPERRKAIKLNRG